MDKQKAEEYIAYLEGQMQFCADQSSQLSYTKEPFAIEKWQACQDSFRDALDKFKQMIGSTND